MKVEIPLYFVIGTCLSIIGFILALAHSLSLLVVVID